MPKGIRLAGKIETNRDDVRLERPAGRLLRRDLKLLATFIEVYCRGQRHDGPKEPVALKFFDLRAIRRKPLSLCESCRKLLVHAYVKRIRCPLDPKPSCKKCPTHCYAPKYRSQIREVMKFSGRRLVLRGRLDYLFHLIG